MRETGRNRFGLSRTAIAVALGVCAVLAGAPIKADAAVVESSVDEVSSVRAGDVSGELAADGEDELLCASAHDPWATGGTCGTCRWWIDDDGTLFIGAGTLASNDGSGSGFWPWYHLYTNITSVKSEDGVVATGSLASMFIGIPHLASADLSGWDTSSVTDMSAMFSGQDSLASINLSGWNTSSVTDMSAMFSNCHDLASLDLSGWDTSSVTDMSAMFDGCHSLASLDLSGWVTPSVTDMSSMFSDCYSLESMDLSGWDTSKVTDMSTMFSFMSVDSDHRNSSLASLDLSGWDTSSVTDMSAMFYRCGSLVSLDLTGWSNSSVVDMGSMFSGCSSLASLDLSGWDTSSVTDMYWMFRGCSSLASLDLSGWDTSSVTDMNTMFYGCPSLETLDLSGWETSKVTIMCDNGDFGGGMFEGCSSLESLDLSGWETSKIRIMFHMFSGCSSLRTVFVGDGWSTASVWNSEGMFGSCGSLVGGRGTAHSVSHEDGEYARVDTPGSPGYFTRAGSQPFSPIDIGAATASGIGAMTYTGSAIMPKITFSYEGEKLKEGEDYTLSYVDNTNAGTATVTAAGMGRYSGTVTLRFTIAPADIASASVAAIPSQRWTGSALEPEVSVTWSGRALTAGTDYEVAYADNVGVGTATATLTGVGNFTGEKAVSFEIVPEAPFFLDATPGDDANHGAEVDWMGRSGVSTGWEVPGGREFRGMKDVKRCDFAAFLYRLADLSDDGVRDDSPKLTDAEVAEVLAGVSDCTPRTDHAAEIAWMIDSGISRGWQDRGKGTVSFRPMASVARQDMAAFLYRFADLDDDGAQNRSLDMGPEKVAFSDVRHGDATNHAPEVEWLASVGVTKGWGPMADGTYRFRGTKTVARQDMAAFMYRLNGRLG